MQQEIKTSKVITAVRKLSSAFSSLLQGLVEALDPPGEAQ
jgi:hypothetical protein